MARNRKPQGADAFDAYYGDMFGSRWRALRTVLRLEPQPVPFCPCGRATYFLDMASAYAAACLPLAKARRILDMCAAPGGKTLVLARRMESGAELFANERSMDRRNRLVKVCNDHLCEPLLGRVHISCSDAALWCTRRQEPFDAILLDAPCSSERHVLADAKYLAQWTAHRARSLAMAQWALLSSGWRILAEGGCLLYVTCALNAAENDAVVQRLLERFPDAQCEGGLAADADFLSQFFPFRQPLPERTRFGFRILPDSSDGAGPLYFCLVRKKMSKIAGRAECPQV